MTRTRYERLVDAGIFGENDRVELLDGLLVAREPQGSVHAMVVGLVRVAWPRRHYVPFLIIEIAVLALVTYVPVLSTWLPSVL
jgi:hypothetical protein